MLRRMAVCTAVIAVMALAVSPALATRGGHGGGKNSPSTATVTSNQSDPHYGDTVTFSVTGADTSLPLQIQLQCFQSGTIVYGETEWYDHTFVLGGSISPWMMNDGGAADCTATLFYWTFHPTQVFNSLATTGFSVAA
jgi:hypothetical protein